MRVKTRQMYHGTQDGSLIQFVGGGEYGHVYAVVLMDPTVWNVTDNSDGRFIAVRLIDLQMIPVDKRWGIV